MVLFEYVSDPDRHAAGRFIADHDQVEIAAVDRAAELARPGMRRLLDARDEVEMALVRVGLEVGVIDAVALGRVIDDQLASLIARAGDTEPVLAVVGHHAVVVTPAVRIGG